MREKLEKDFYHDEFRCRCGCSRLKMQQGFMKALQGVRNELALPMHVTSGCRCAEYNLKIDGHPKSLHICNLPQHKGQEGTLAVDIAAVDGAYRGALFTVAWKHGFSIGWNKSRGFLHLDRRDFLGMPQTSFDY